MSKIGVVRTVLYTTLCQAAEKDGTPLPQTATPEIAAWISGVAEDLIGSGNPVGEDEEG